MIEEHFTPSGVRLRLHTRRPGGIDWLFLPGGPGIGSESLAGLVDAAHLPGSAWLVDLPGDGSNTGIPEPEGGWFRDWPGVVAEAARAVPGAVFVGHSTGGMYLLSVSELEPLIRGLVLVSTAPDSAWHPRFVQMAARNPLPAVDEAARVFEAARTNEALRDIAVASAEWNFTPAGVDAGRALLARMPYNYRAVDWSDAHFDHTYAARWWPASLPAMILAGREDRIVDQTGWDAPRFHTPNVLRRTIDAAGHFPWIEQADAVREAFGDFIRILQASGAAVHPPEPVRTSGSG